MQSDCSDGSMKLTQDDVLALCDALRRVETVLAANRDFHRFRDALRSKIELSKEIDLSPLTVETEKALNITQRLVTRLTVPVPSNSEEEKTEAS